VVLSCIDPARNGEASYADPNGAIVTAVKAKLDNYQHDYSERNFLFGRHSAAAPHRAVMGIK
jgi:hypothetical protein